MVGAVPTIGYHFSEKELMKEKSGHFLSWSLQGCSEPASQARGLAWILALKMKIEIVGTSDLYLVRFMSLNLFNWCSKEETILNGKRKWLRGVKMFRYLV